MWLLPMDCKRARYGIAAMFRSDTEELDRVLALGVDTAAHRAVARTASLQL